MTPAAADPTDSHQRAREVARLADFLDACIPIPGTNWRIGAESVLGLIPGIGDFAGLIVGLIVVHRAARAGAPPALVRRMAANVAIDALVGVIPVVGDVFDFAFKSNQRNARLLLEHIGEAPPRLQRPPWWLAVMLALLAAGSTYLIVRAVWG
jgi:hypothetical protein